MAANSLQNAAERASPAGGPKPRGKPFRKGQSGNPVGRIRGSRNKKTLAAELLLEGEAEALTRKAIEMALEGDPTALKLCFESLHSRRRHRSLRLDLPPLKGPADPGPFMTAIAAAIAGGEITSGEASELALVIEASQAGAIVVGDEGVEVGVALGVIEETAVVGGAVLRHAVEVFAKASVEALGHAVGLRPEGRVRR